MSPSEIVLETIDLARDFGGRQVLKDVSLTAGQGEVLALLGPNGVGKSTLMKLIAGLLMPSRGVARLWGRPTWLPSLEMSRVACILDGVSPPSNVRVADIMALKGSTTKTFDRKLAQSLCEQHQILPHNRWHSLSKGQKRWVQLVSALASGAELMLFDEPADGLDVATRRELYGLLRDQANNRGVTVIVASHIIADVERIADDVAILTDGSVQLHSPLEQLRDEVCEVELRSEDSLTSIAAVAEIISSRHAGELTIAVVRFRSPHLADQPLPGEVGRRRIDLEELYLAYTQPHAPSQSSETAVV